MGIERRELPAVAHPSPELSTSGLIAGAEGLAQAIDECGRHAHTSTTEGVSSPDFTVGGERGGGPFRAPGWRTQPLVYSINPLRCAVSRELASLNRAACS